MLRAGFVNGRGDEREETSEMDDRREGPDLGKHPWNSPIYRRFAA